jgi:3-oxoacyl-[acyl-carrier protein] reductase
VNRFEGKVVIVTGGSRGIGAAIVRGAAAEGASVVVNFRRDADAAWELARAIEATGGKAYAAKADVSHADQCDALVEEAINRYGQVDVLINNAGITRDNLLASMTDEEWDEVLRVNAGSVHRMCRAVARPMILRKKGRIVNISSVAGLKGGRGQTNYSASKGAIEAFTRALAVELAGKGICVNAVAPGVVITEMTAEIREAAGEEVLGRILLKRYGSPEDVARAVLFLASEDASYITGAVLSVDGGFKMG